MKLIIIVINILHLVIVNSLFSQNKSSWSVNFSNEKVFIENKGQFNGRTWQQESDVKYGINGFNGLDVFFTNNGLSYRFDKMIKNPNRDVNSKSEHEKVSITELINVIWVNANKNVDIIAEETVTNYFSYAIRKPFSNEVYNVNYLNGYKRLTYRNIYDNIDVVYELFDKGLKYKILVHPGADISKIKMKYVKRNSNNELGKINCYLDDNGNYNIKTSLGDIQELKPYCYYQNSEFEVKSNFKFENEILSFEADYDHSKEFIIDPWVISANFNSSTAVWEVETDSIGNIYVIGGENPMQLKKFNSLGILQWTYTTPWDTSNVWLGTLKTDNTGTSYITSGTAPEMEKINAVGGLLWHVNGLVMNEEWWAITLNCNKSRIIVGGTYLNSMSMYAKARIIELDINNGNVLFSQDVDSVSLNGVNAYPVEVRSIASSNNGKHIFLTHMDIGMINEDISTCSTNMPIFQVDNGHHFGYKCENYLPATQNGGGLKALIANDQYIYVHRGDSIDKRLLGNGSLVGSVPLTGGNATTVPLIGGLVLGNSGLALDYCGNVYAGSGDRVVKFDADLNFIAEELLPFSVYDVSVNSNGEVLAVGAQFDNQSVNRNGKIQSVNMGACPQLSMICCGANICIPDTFCVNDLPTDLISASAGGVWSGLGITNPTNGTFDPSIAGPGVHTVYYTLPCGNDSVNIVVSSCVALIVCQEDNGNITVSSGVGQYTWEYYVPASSTPITNQTECEACGYIWYGFPLNQCDLTGVTTCNTTSYWSILDTGSTITPGLNYPIRVIDLVGNYTIITDINSLPQCISKIDENDVGFIYKVIPNPSFSDFTILFNSDINEEIKITLINSAGKEVFQSIIHSKESIIPGKNLSKGLYLLRVKIGDRTFIEKISKS